ncbi:MAG TPA: hypothetical protein VNH84_21060, partial [Candidatus Saccharimonadales bacterium]|nr:hypothetical protein [Candidatus Saccharimonadales bacterium]
STRAADLAGDFKGPLGLQLYTLRESFKTNVPATLDKVKELDFTDIESVPQSVKYLQRVRF